MALGRCPRRAAADALTTLLVLRAAADRGGGAAEARRLDGAAHGHGAGACARRRRAGARRRRRRPLRSSACARGRRPTCAPGDVVCATELRREGARPDRRAGRARCSRRRCGGAACACTSARSSRSTTSTTAPERGARSQDDGVLAVDMESAWLADAADGRPLAVVRVVVDSADRDLLRPAHDHGGRPRAAQPAPRGGGARRVGAGASARAPCCSPAPRSFCAGVERAIEIVERALEQHGAPVYVRKQIVHNEHVVADLERRGAVFVDELDEVPDGRDGRLLRPRRVAGGADRRRAPRSLDVIDATCPLVGKVHAEARHFAADGRHDLPRRPRRARGGRGHAGRGARRDPGRRRRRRRGARRRAGPDARRRSSRRRRSRSTRRTRSSPRCASASRSCAGRRRTTSATRRRTGSRPCAPSRARRTSCSSSARRTPRTRCRLVEVARREGTRAYLVDDERRRRRCMAARRRHGRPHRRRVRAQQLVDRLVAVAPRPRPASRSRSA